MWRQDSKVIGIFGPKRHKNGEWRKLHNELHIHAYTHTHYSQGYSLNLKDQDG